MVEIDVLVNKINGVLKNMRNILNSIALAGLLLTIFVIILITYDSEKYFIFRHLLTLGGVIIFLSLGLKNLIKKKYK